MNTTVTIKVARNTLWLLGQRYGKRKGAQELVECAIADAAQAEAKAMLPRALEPTHKERLIIEAMWDAHSELTGFKA